MTESSSKIKGKMVISDGVIKTSAVIMESALCSENDNLAAKCIIQIDDITKNISKKEPTKPVFILIFSKPFRIVKDDLKCEIAFPKDI